MSVTWNKPCSAFITLLMHVRIVRRPLLRDVNITWRSLILLVWWTRGSHFIRFISGLEINLWQMMSRPLAVPAALCKRLADGASEMRCFSRARFCKHFKSFQWCGTFQSWKRANMKCNIWYVTSIRMKNATIICSIFNFIMPQFKLILN